MLYRIFLITIFFAGSMILGTVTVQAQNARIKIDLDRTIGEVNKHIYGNFVEHLGRCVYEGIYDTASALSDNKDSGKM
jgi:alpha-N-arabinofuranosidase